LTATIATCRGADGGSAPSGSGTSRPVRSGPATVAFPGLHRQSDDSWCLYTWYFVYEPLPSDEVVQAAARAWAMLAPDYPPCPGQPLDQTNPVVYAIRFWRDVPLPRPAPSIAPGWGLTGKAAFLETHGERQHVYGSTTPFGPLSLTASGRYYVDWGDGTSTGPHDVEGAPWPNGSITHTYIDVGQYDVVLTEQWSATWQIGDVGGHLTGLRTTGRIDDFRVEQIQVVVTPG